MIETLWGFIASWWILFGSVIILSFLVSYDSVFWASVVFAISLLSFFTITSFSWQINLAIILSYLPLGFFWSLHRWKRHCINASHSHELNARRYVGDITYWIVFWPFSMVSNIFKDIAEAVEGFVRKHIAGLFTNIAKKYEGKFDD